MNELGLSLVEKTVYAIIYGFSQDGDSEFSGSRQYLADWCGCSSLRTIDAALRTLLDRHLIVKNTKTVNGVKFCTYVVDCTGSAKIAQGVVQNCPGGSAKIAHNNIEDNKDNNIDASTRAHARVAARKKFDFKAALISAGISGEYADKLIAIRKSKRLTNSERAANDLNAAITTICNTQGLVPDEVVKFCIDHNWGAIRPDWEGVEHIKARTPRSRTVRSLQEIMQRDGTIF